MHIIWNWPWCQPKGPLTSGEFPVGAVIVSDGRVVAEGYRAGTGSLTGRPSEIDHAEMRALKEMEGLPPGFNIRPGPLFFPPWSPV